MWHDWEDLWVFKRQSYGALGREVHMRNFGMKVFVAAASLSACAMFAQAAAASTIVNNGVSYSLDYSVVDPANWMFTLTISGINGTSDTQTGKYGITAFGLTEPTTDGTTTATAPTGFTVGSLSGGLSNSSGNCSGTGSLVCFDAITTPSTVLADNSSLSYSFKIGVTSGTMPTDFLYHLKVNWIGERKNYDLVSQDIDPSLISTVPLPATALLLAGAIGGLGVLRRRKKAA